MAHAGTEAALREIRLRAEADVTSSRQRSSTVRYRALGQMCFAAVASQQVVKIARRDVRHSDTERLKPSNSGRASSFLGLQARQDDDSGQAASGTSRNHACSSRRRERPRRSAAERRAQKAGARRSVPVRRAHGSGRARRAPSLTRNSVHVVISTRGSPAITTS